MSELLLPPVGAPRTRPDPGRGAGPAPVSAAPAVAITASKDSPELRALLAQIHRVMGADTVTVLLVDRTRSVLEPAATVGLDLTLRGARPVPIGHGFAGRVAQTRQFVVLEDVTPNDVINPVLLAHGLRGLLGVPVVDGGELLGVLHIGFRRRHEFQDDEARLLTGFAATLSEILNLRAHDSDHTAALALQRSLLPAAPVGPATVELAARYVPADGDLGGDWYDVFTLPDERLCLVMGDVAGHGLDAAIVMGRLRSALRAYALDHEAPEEILRRLDRKICHFEQDVLATVLVGIAAPPYDTWQFSSAGHFPPLVAAPGELGEVVHLSQDPLLGVVPETERRSTTVVVPEGGRICLFTDGLIERRPRDGQAAEHILDTNVGRLREALAVPGDAEMGCIHVLTGVVGEDQAEDDIAVLIAQRH